MEAGDGSEGSSKLLEVQLGGGLGEGGVALRDAHAGLVCDSFVYTYTFIHPRNFSMLGPNHSLYCIPPLGTTWLAG